VFSYFSEALPSLPSFDGARNRRSSSASSAPAAGPSDADGTILNDLSTDLGWFHQQVVRRKESSEPTEVLNDLTRLFDQISVCIGRYSARGDEDLRLDLTEASERAVEVLPLVVWIVAGKSRQGVDNLFGGCMEGLAKKLGWSFSTKKALLVRVHEKAVRCWINAQLVMTSQSDAMHKAVAVTTLALKKVSGLMKEGVAIKGDIANAENKRKLKDISKEVGGVKEALKAQAEAQGAQNNQFHHRLSAQEAQAEAQGAQIRAAFDQYHHRLTMLEAQEAKRAKFTRPAGKEFPCADPQPEPPRHGPFTQAEIDHQRQERETQERNHRMQRELAERQQRQQAENERRQAEEARTQAEAADS